MRSYHRAFPANFVAGKGTELFDDSGRRYLDFFVGAGALSFGHNHPELKQTLIDYLAGDGLLHALDLETPARGMFRDAVQVVLDRRGLDWTFLVPGPTGTNAVEVALKLARRTTGRRRVIAFGGGFHGMSLGALAVTSNRSARAAGSTALPDVTHIPFPDLKRPWTQHSLEMLADMLDDTHSGVDLPAAVILESVQAEGGVNPAPHPWLRGLSELCKARGILLISDDIQVGLSRTGSFFSLEAAGVVPDIIVLAKALTGLGLPLSLVLYRRDLDTWEPGDHNGTFRGNQLAFVAAASAIPMLDDVLLQASVLTKGDRLAELLSEQLARTGVDAEIRHRGLIVGVDLDAQSRTSGKDLGSAVSRECFARGLLVEAVGRHDRVIKFLPPLNVSMEHLEAGAVTFGDALAAAL